MPCPPLLPEYEGVEFWWSAKGDPPGSSGHGHGHEGAPMLFSKSIIVSQINQRFRDSAPAHYILIDNNFARRFNSPHRLRSKGQGYRLLQLIISVSFTSTQTSNLPFLTPPHVKHACVQHTCSPIWRILYQLTVAYLSIARSMPSLSTGYAPNLGVFLKSLKSQQLETSIENLIS